MLENWYNRHILPPMLDMACGMQMISRIRQGVVPLAVGRVLEVGIGTGLNMRHYNRQQVTHITGLDPALHMHPVALERIERPATAAVGQSGRWLPPGPRHYGAAAGRGLYAAKHSDWLPAGAQAVYLSLLG